MLTAVQAEVQDTFLRLDESKTLIPSVRDLYGDGMFTNNRTFAKSKPALQLYFQGYADHALKLQEEIAAMVNDLTGAQLML